MDSLLKNKKSIVLLVILVLGFFIYSMLAPDATIAPAETSPGEDLIKVAQDLSAINFDQSIFKTPGYKLLVDWSPVVPAQAIGRTNPFEVIGRD